MKHFDSVRLGWLVSCVLYPCLVCMADAEVPCLIFSGNSDKEYSIDLSSLNRISFGDNSMVISSSKDENKESVELIYSLYHHLEIGDAEPAAVQAESIVLSQETATLKVGELFTITAIVLPENTKDKTVTWSSSDESIASVDADGTVIALEIGEAIITATCGDVSATCTLTVVATPAETILISQETANLKVGETIMLSATVLPDDATDKTITWSSSDESIASVDADGTVTALAIGEAIITATCGEVSATCTVTVVANPAETILISQETANLKVGETIMLSATVLPDNATDKTVTWSSSDESITSVDADGTVTALAIGEAIITATCGDVSATCTVTVEDLNGVETVYSVANNRFYVDTRAKLLYLYSESDSTFTVGIYDLNSQLVWSSELFDGDIVSLESLVPGVYMAIANNGKTKFNLKFILK